MKKIVLILSGLLAASLLSGCGSGPTSQPSQHTHDFESGEWGSNDLYHWKVCACGEMGKTEEHHISGSLECIGKTMVDGFPQDTYKGKCAVCGHEATTSWDALPHKETEFAYEYDQANDGYILRAFAIADNDDLIIPDTYNNKPVIGIGLYRSTWSINKKNFKIVIPKSVKSIITGDKEDEFDDYRYGLPISGVYYEGNLSDWLNIDFTLREDVFMARTLWSVNESTPLFFEQSGGGFHLGDKDYNEVYDVTVPEGVTEIKNYQFSGLAIYNLFGANKLTHIGRHAFSRTLIKEKLELNAQLIEAYAFHQCKNLNVVVLKDGVQDVRTGAFSDCNRLVSVTIGANVTSICSDGNEQESTVFAGSRLCEVVNKSALESSNESLHTRRPWGYSPIFTAVSQVELNRETGAMIFTSTSNNQTTKMFLGTMEFRKNTIIPEGVTMIEDYAFSGSVLGEVDEYNYESITIPKTVNDISIDAFYSSNVTWAIFYDGTLKDWMTIYRNSDMYFSGKPAFMLLDENGSVTQNNKHYTMITEAVVPDDVTEIRMFCFANIFSHLTKVTIPTSVILIRDCAFRGCDSLTAIEYQGTVAQWNAIEAYNNSFEGISGVTVTCTDGTVTL